MKTRLTLILVAAALVFAGCLISGTFSIHVSLVDVNTSFTNGVVSESVDLADEDDTWADHADKIEQIEKVLLDAIVRNDLTTQDTLDVYISATSSYASAAAVEGASDAYPVLLGYVAKAGPNGVDTLTIKESEGLLQLSGGNFTNIKNLIKTGVFTVYITSTGATAQGTLLEANIYITFTASE